MKSLCSDSRRSIDRITGIVLIATGFLGALVPILSVLDDNLNITVLSWDEVTAPITLMIASMLSMALGLERFSTQQRINEKLDNLSMAPDRIIQALDGIGCLGHWRAGCLVAACSASRQRVGAEITMFQSIAPAVYFLP